MGALHPARSQLVHPTPCGCCCSRTCSQVDASGVDVSKFEDSYFKAAEKKGKKAKGEGEFFSAPTVRGPAAVGDERR